MRRMSNLLKILAIMALTNAYVQAHEGVLVAKNVNRLPTTAQDPMWNEAVPITLPLAAQNFILPHGGGSVGQVEVQALTTKTEIAFRLTWKDATRNDTWDTSARFTDGCAVQLPVDPNILPSPFMGEKGKPVTIWRWRAIGHTPMEARAPKAYVDYYRPDALHTVVPLPSSPVEHLIAEGFGTVAPHPKPQIEGEGAYKTDGWTVVMRGSRPAKEVFPFAVAVWEGGASDRDGAKSLTFWHWVSVGGKALPVQKTPVKKGRIVFERYGCATCHGEKGVGGVPNPNSQTGPTIPPLQDLREKFTEAELITLIQQGVIPERADPKGPPPFRRMPAWVTVSDEEMSDLLKYLLTLKSGKKSGDGW